MERYQFIPCEAWGDQLALHPADLAPEERAALDAHVAGCPACAAVLADYQTIDSLVREVFVTRGDVPPDDWSLLDEPEIHLPTLPARGRYDNLPARPDEMLGREDELQKLLETLDSFQPFLAIEGMAGVGKTTLAIEVAYQALYGSGLLSTSLFDSVVWVSARTHLEQKRWLSEVLNTVARVLDYPSVAQLHFEEKRLRVYELLRTHQTLVVIDNFDTIDDPALLNWIQHVPFSCKVLVTSRDGQPLHRAWTLHLAGLHSEGALDLIRHYARKLELTAIMDAGTGNLLELVRITRGNPQAIAMTLGNVKGRGLSLSQALDGLAGSGDVLDQLFMRSWEALTTSPGTQRVLLTLLFFAGSASGEAIGTVANLEHPQLEGALERLVDLSLIERYRCPGEASTRYGLHPLAHAFLSSRLRELPAWEAEARDRWVGWWLAFVQRHGGPDGAEWARQYDPLEEEWENLMLVCAWCRDNNRYEAVRTFWSSAGLLGMTSIYGYWKERICWLRRVLQEAERRADWTTAVEAMAEQGFTLVQTGHIDEARTVFKQAWNRRHFASPDAQLTLTENIVQWHIKSNDFRKAQSWLKKADHLLHTSGLDGLVRKRHLLTIQYFYGIIYLEKQDRSRAETCFRVVLASTQEIGWQRGTVYVWQFLADIARWRGEFDRAETLLKDGLAIAERNKDRRRTAYYKRSLAYLLLQRDRHRGLKEAINWARQAQDDFERLSMAPEVHKLRNLLKRLHAFSPETPHFVEDIYASASELSH